MIALVIVECVRVRIKLDIPFVMVFYKSGCEVFSRIQN